jgi:hypothetical protein
LVVWLADQQNPQGAAGCGGARLTGLADLPRSVQVSAFDAIDAGKLLRQHLPDAVRSEPLQQTDIVDLVFLADDPKNSGGPFGNLCSDR